eukprot:TRINITY_DN10123_c0_g1_i1.p1 TRINITY_DN10123_c0_g1~~TRINITY_DN10123_c0_g1_i1.p1  ORF type:complete len:385 (+),score=66.21 TRINITY_DN10123_c0_g1_i1:152-1156(+)
MAHDEELQQLQTDHDLTENQIAAFRTVFGFLDVDKSGVVTAEELHHRLVELEIDVSKEEVICAMTMFSDSADHIDFKGFLHYMTCNQTYARTLTTSESARQEAILFLAVTKYIESKKKTPNKTGHDTHHVAELENYYVAKAKTYHPHVISDFAAGWRLLGLTERQFCKHFEGLKKGQRINSPYAQIPSMHLFKLANSNSRKMKPMRHSPASRARVLPDDAAEETIAPVNNTSRLHRSKYHRRSFELPALPTGYSKVLHTTGGFRELYVDDLSDLRKQTEEIRHKFLQEQCRKNKRMFHDHWHQVRGDDIESKTLKRRLKSTFMAYQQPRPQTIK